MRVLAAFSEASDCVGVRVLNLMAYFSDTAQQFLCSCELLYLCLFTFSQGGGGSVSAAGNNSYDQNNEISHVFTTIQFLDDQKTVTHIILALEVLYQARTWTPMENIKTSRQLVLFSLLQTLTCSARLPEGSWTKC